MNRLRRLRSEESHLVERLDRAYDSLVSPGYVGGSGGPGGGGFEPQDVFRLNAAIRKSSGIDELEDRLQTVRAEIAELEGD